MSMSEEHRQKLKKNWAVLVKELVVDDDFLALFEQEDIFTESNSELILSKAVSSAKAREFLNLVQRRGEDAWPVLIQALVSSKQLPLAKRLDPELTQKFKEGQGSSGARRNEVTPITETQPGPTPTTVPVQPASEDAVMTKLIDAMKHVDISADSLEREDAYVMRKNPRGRALIINNSKFTPESQCKARAGAEYDGINLRDLFKSLYFETELKENLTAEALSKVLSDEAQKPEHKDADAFVLCVLSHGAKGSILSTDGKEVNIEEDIIQQFSGKRCPSLIKKPKVIIIQACQGTGSTVGVVQADDATAGGLESFGDRVRCTLQEGDTSDFVPGPKEDSETCHELADMLIAYATCPGYKAYRIDNAGSWFVRALVEVVSKDAYKDHLGDLLTTVRNIVAQQRTNKLMYDEPKNLQLPQTNSRLLKKLFFFPGYSY